MIEIRAAQVFAHIEKNDSTKVSFLIKSLIENSRTYFPNGWDEKPYGLDDMDHGSYGSITSAICALALIKALKLELEKDQQKQIIEKLNKVFDTFYFLENNGHIIKNLINKSKVFNTDLLVALAIAKYLEILPKGSVRKKLFKEICLRCINKTISSQLPNGAFRYHELSIGVPFLYQAMCTSLLFTLSNYISHPYIYKSAYKGSSYLLKNYDGNNFSFNWSKANCKDKSGSIWIYGWIPTILDSVNKKKDFDAIINHFEKVQLCDGNFKPFDIENNLDTKTDNFYSALMVVALSISESVRIKKTNLKKSDYIFFYDIFYFFSGIFKLFHCIVKQFKRKLLNKFLPLGALENENW